MKYSLDPKSHSVEQRDLACPYTHIKKKQRPKMDEKMDDTTPGCEYVKLIVYTSGQMLPHTKNLLNAKSPDAASLESTPFL